VDEKRIPKRILESNSIGKIPAGKPRKRWVSAVEIESSESESEKLEKRISEQSSMETPFKGN
jgi:hypothetical protein